MSYCKDTSDLGPRQHQGDTAQIDGPLPPNWMSTVDAVSGDTYYWNIHTGHTQWEHPG